MRHNRGAVSVGELVKVNMGMGCLKNEGFYETIDGVGSRGNPNTRDDSKLFFKKNCQSLKELELVS
jgi:hypothetical protein